MANITKLSYQNKELLLLGTAHVSQASVEEVQQAILTEKPDTICIELDQSRYQSLTNPQGWQELDITQIIKEKRVSYLLVNMILAAQQNKMAKQVDLSSGAEIKAAIDLAHQLDIPLVLADRDIKTTFMRIFRSLNLWEKAKLFTSILVSVFDKSEVSVEEIEKLKQADMLDLALQEITKDFPNIKKVLVDERDQFLAHQIQNAPGTRILAVMGAAHTVGLKKIITEPVELGTIEEIPPVSTGAKLWPWLLPLPIFLIIGYSFYKNMQFGIAQIGVWILWNGIAAALGCLLMRAHILTVLAAFVFAPLTSVTPVIGVGMITAYLETVLRKPKVKDFQDLAADTQTLKGYFRNRVTRIMILFLVSNLFSAIATFSGGINIFTNLLGKLAG